MWFCPCTVYSVSTVVTMAGGWCTVASVTPGPVTPSRHYAVGPQRAPGEGEGDHTSYPVSVHLLPSVSDTGDI